MSKTLIGLLTAIALCRCATINPDGTSNCGIMVAGDFDDRFAKPTLFQDTLNALVDEALDGATFTTDWRLNDQLGNCQKLWGFRVYTKPTWNYLVKTSETPDGPLLDTYVSGHTLCEQKLIVVGTPTVRAGWSKSSLVHEIFHALQDCTTPEPMDKGLDWQHRNWVRDGLYNAIEYEKTRSLP
jgi:hypothetical protein